MKADELREKYLAFFQSLGHSRQGSDVLVPTWDPSVLFTPAGMNQFKDHFLGKVKLDFTRATTCQKCLRTGDIDNVGRTAYHHTFFEMLGNFSFGDYFKNEAIAWAWQFLTDRKWLGIDPQRLSVTVYKDDDEAAKIWNEKIGLPTARISRMEEDENFWPASAPSQGPDGVCGPCSEIYYALDSGGNVEIWNLVFTQFNRVGNPPDNLRPLPSKNIDTGMGLERTASVLQGVPSNFHIDILFPIVKAAAQVCGTQYEYQSDNGRRLRRITDHVRACTFAIHENVYPGPKKARYVIKRLIRRAVLDGHQMGMRQPFLYQLVPAVAQAMATAYPELVQTTERVAQVLRNEEADFFATIDAGLDRMQSVFQELETKHRGMVDGAEAANLYQTHGVPPELFQALAAERNLTFDWDGYRAAMHEHEKVSGTGKKELFQTGPIETLKEALLRTDFLGYETSQAQCTLRGIIVGKSGEDRLVGHVRAVGLDAIRVVLDRTPFYAESGGQVGDTGTLQGDNFLMEITDTQKAGELIVHTGVLKSGEMKEGAQVTATVQGERRGAIARAHSATHILHHALQQTLGSHAQQQGSRVEADWLRFDFTNQEALTESQLGDVERKVLTRIADAKPIRWELVSLAQARQAGAMMLFGEKYPDPVRMVSMGDFSRELCGGTHLTSTQQVEAFELVSDESISAGTRRIIALTGPKALQQRKTVQGLAQRAADQLDCSPTDLAFQAATLTQQTRRLKKQLASAGADAGDEPTISRSAAPTSPDYTAIRSALRLSARILNVSIEDVPARIAALIAEQSQLKHQLALLQQSGQTSAADLLKGSETISGVRLVVAETPGANANLMRQWIDQIRKSQSEPTAILLASKAGDDKVVLVCGLSQSLVDRKLSAGAWIGPVAAEVGGGGGGKADLAQAGGKDPTKLPDALATAKRVWREMMGA
jgi:alanyl-tRNA synthetase